MTELPYESRILLAIQALENNPKLTLRAAAKTYKVRRTTLTQRRAGRTARCNTRANLINLIKSEEEAIISYVIELSIRVFPPRIYSIKEMANILLYIRGTPPVGVN
jgi:hypothetical protein